MELKKIELSRTWVSDTVKKFDEYIADILKRKQGKLNRELTKFLNEKEGENV